MAIGVKVRDASLVQREDGSHGIALALETSNDDHPGERIRFSLVYPTSMSAAEIKTEIDAAVQLLWQARAMPQWTV